ncbi:MAG TPA: efflux RND transporter periplasmic adaptor subunit [Pyrinomonadaceae bacterium]|jgi:multidrug efflux pump subunit AcrA (membrane-fusion protein)|nr:efflux RND transporter periplasmic adaptor subunit [Pyrinomonadaceae bacterium]
MKEADENTTTDDGREPPENQDTEKWLGVRRERLAANRRRNVIIVASVAVVALIALLLLIRYLRKPAATDEEPNVRVSVHAAKVEREAISARITAVGTIFPREKAEVSAKVSAPIKQMALLKNKPVKAGEVIAVLESRDLVAQRNEAAAALNQERASERSVVTGTIPQTDASDQKAVRDAQAKVVNAHATYERRQVLYQKGGISKKELEASQLELTTAENELRLAEQTAKLRATALNPNDRALAAARVQAAQQHLATLDAQLSYATIRAPISGVVTDQFQYQGEFAAAGGKLVEISDMSQVIVKAPFADTVTAQLKVGDSAAVLPTDTSAAEMTGQVTLISRASDPLNRSVEVWVTLGNGDGKLRANGAAQVTISAQTKSEAIVVPASAVTLEASNADEGTVMVVDATNVAHEIKVTVGIRTAEKMEITSGLQGGESVIAEGNYALADGTKVEISEAKPAEPDGAADEEKKKEP